MLTVLFIGDVDQSIKATSYANEYLRDTIYHGLMSLPDVKTYTTSPIKTVHTIYKDQIPISRLWGRGFSTSFLLDQDPLVINDQADLTERIKDRFFDVVIYGDVRVCRDHLDLISSCYPPNKIFMLDGRDDSAIMRINDNFLYFKRELCEPREHVLPISFSIPECKITSYKLGASSAEKKYYLANVVPFNESTYTYKDEALYYLNMQESFFALTMMKNGWDCMRHYEIMANGCVPIFFNIENCPGLTLTHFPKQLCRDAFNLFKNFDFFNYMPLVSAFMDHVSLNNTTTRMASYVLGHIS